MNVEQGQRWFFYVLKIFLSGLALWLISQKIDWLVFSEVFQRIRLPTLLFAFVLYNFSQLLGAVRSRVYLGQIGIHLDHVSNCCLYYLGMFYNLFLPGGIGGDGYKVYFLRKYFSGKTFAIVQALLFDRLNGFVGLVVLAVWAMQGMEIPLIQFLSSLQILGLTAVFVLGVGLVQSFLMRNHFWLYAQTLLLSIVIQCVQAFAALLIIWSLGDFHTVHAYVLIFLLSSIAVQLPLSMGGIGAREVTVVYLLNMLHIDPTIGLAMALLYFIIQSLSNCIGVLFFDFQLKVQPSINS